ncbi:hypothetical protein BC628DRAFT_1368950 [Trametes gibbosa]|nr:hypothetical protein BC628DRAFT_1368950 [Trametes gibbosa]
MTPEPRCPSFPGYTASLVIRHPSKRRRACRHPHPRHAIISVHDRQPRAPRSRRHARAATCFRHARPIPIPGTQLHTRAPQPPLNSERRSATPSSERRAHLTLLGARRCTPPVCGLVVPSPGHSHPGSPHPTSPRAVRGVRHPRQASQSVSARGTGGVRCPATNVTFNARVAPGGVRGFAPDVVALDSNSNSVWADAERRWRRRTSFECVSDALPMRRPPRDPRGE